MKKILLLILGAASLFAQSTPDVPKPWSPQYIVATGISFDYYGKSGFAALTSFGFKPLATSNAMSFTTLEMTAQTATIRTGGGYPIMQQGNWSIIVLGDGGISTGTGQPTLASLSGGGFVTYDICAKITKGLSHCGLAGGARILTNVSQGVNPVGEFLFTKAW